MTAQQGVRIQAPQHRCDGVWADLALSYTYEYEGGGQWTILQPPPPDGSPRCLRVMECIHCLDFLGGCVTIPQVPTVH